MHYCVLLGPCLKRPTTVRLVNRNAATVFSKYSFSLTVNWNWKHDLAIWAKHGQAECIVKICKNCMHPGHYILFHNIYSDMLDRVIHQDSLPMAQYSQPEKGHIRMICHRKKPTITFFRALARVGSSIHVTWRKCRRISSIISWTNCMACKMSSSQPDA